MNIGIYTDPHYSSQELTGGNRYNSRSLDKMKAAYRDFEAAGCERIVCLGDLTDTDESREREVDNMRQIAALFAACPIPTTVVMGNHDAYVFEPAEFYALLGGCEPRDVVMGNTTLLFLNANHNPDGSPYHPHAFRWDECYLPTEGLRERLDAARGDVYVFLHQNLDAACPADHRPRNADEVHRILADSGKVKAVYQGHYHWGADTERDGIRYVTLPATCCYDNTHKIIEL
ncbi:MAG: metallophosphoesterase [Clostridia bacterium]|nr:metallophosphoesterase [Clostridia bacterium]